ncbi:MAG: hypothetical protein QCI38_04635 [Candidatus Thermoplasmatota archaeon]|nr:hypothetical protein [Candidatus Thermoplasmatota archaeon]
MARRTIRSLAYDQQEEWSKPLAENRVIDREIQGHWARYRENKLLKVVMGVRRSGKTVFSHQLLRGNEYAFANFDDERLAYI